MSGLLLRYSADEGVLRSVGDPPNGILGIAAPGDVAMFVIDTSWLPLKKAKGQKGQHIVAHASQDGITATSTPIGLTDAVDACESEREIEWLLRAPALALCAAAQVNASRPVPFAILFIQSHVDLVEQMRDALIARGMLSYRDTPDG